MNMRLQLYPGLTVTYYVIIKEEKISITQMIKIQVENEEVKTSLIKTNIRYWTKWN